MEHVFAISRTANGADFYNKEYEVDAKPPILVAPQNTPLGHGVGGAIATPRGTVVDVVREYYWTHSKLIESRQEVPSIILTEKRLKTNALIAQLKYSYGASLENASSILRSGIIPEGIANPIVEWAKKAQETISGSTSNTAQQAPNIGQALTDIQQASQSVNDNNPIYKDNPYLKPYKDLYITEDTGWEFILPYFENYNNSSQNAFTSDAGNSSGLSFLQQGLGIGNTIADITSVLRAPTQVTFTEKAKFYNYSTEGEEFSFSFPLINTGSATFDDVVRNWEFLFLLLYNNKPARTSTAVVDPPVIYQVEIPGIKFFPFCYLSNLQVEFQGSRREMSFSLPVTDNLNVDASIPAAGPTRPGEQAPTGQVRAFNNNAGSRNITTIIPDAYLVRLTVKSLLPETKNFMYRVLNRGNVVSTQTLTTGINSLLTSVGAAVPTPR